MLTGLPRRYTRSEGKGEREVSPFGFYRQSSADRGPHRTFRSVVSTLSLSLARALCQPENQQPDKNKKTRRLFVFKNQNHSGCANPNGLSCSIQKCRTLKTIGLHHYTTRIV